MSTAAEVSWLYRLDKKTLANFMADVGVTGFDPEDSIDDLRKKAVAFVKEGNTIEPGDGVLRGAARAGVSVSETLTNNLSLEQLTKLSSFTFTSPVEVLSFIISCIEILDRKVINECDLLKVLLNVCTGRVRQILSEVLSEGQPSFDLFRTRVINMAIPVSLSFKWQNQLVFRKQRPDEPLHEYIQSIIDHERAFELKLSEKALVEIITDNLREEVKRDCVLQKVPETFRDLFSLADRIVGLNFERKASNVEASGGTAVGTSKGSGDVSSFNVVRGQAPVDKTQLCEREGNRRGGFHCQGHGSLGKAEFVPNTSAEVRQLRCVNCNKFGHTAFVCQSKKVAFKDRKCFRCNETGHLRYDCPRSGNM